MAAKGKGGPYKAGTIFLQVVPSFDGVQDKIRREADKWNRALDPAMEKAGDQAGEKAAQAIEKQIMQGTERTAKKAARQLSTDFHREFRSSVKSLQKALAPIGLTADTKGVHKELKEVKREIDDLAKTEIISDESAQRAERRLRKVGQRLDLLRGDVDLDQALNLDRAIKQVDTFAKRIADVSKGAQIGDMLDERRANRQLTAFEDRLQKTLEKAARAFGDTVDPELERIQKDLVDLSRVEIDVDMDADEAEQKARLLEIRLKMLSQQEARPKAELVGIAAALSELSAFNAALTALGARTVRPGVKVDVDEEKMGLFRALFKPSDGNAETAANSFRSFNAVILAAAILIPALIPLIGALGGALLALVPIIGSVVAGFGAVALAFSGIGDAVKALGDVEDDAAKDANAAAKTIRSASYAVVDARQAVGDAERNAARAAEDSERRVAAARRSAADAIERAVKRQRDAQERYRDSVDAVREAERDLREARKRARQEERDTDFALRSNQVAQRQAVIDLFEATNRNTAVRADGGATNTEREQAAIDLEEARLNLERLRTEEKRLQAERDKQQKQGIEGSERVVDAQDRLLDALENQRKAEENLREAARDTARARVDGARQVRDALRDQARQQEDSARSIARAQENLRRAQESYGQALYDTGVLGSASARALEEAFDNLGPAGQRFALFIHSLRGGFKNLRDEVQEAFLPAVERGMRRIINRYGPQFTAFMATMGAAMGSLFEQFAASLEGPAWTRFFGTMERLAPIFAMEFGQGMINWMEAFANIMSVVAPYAAIFSAGLLGMSEAFAGWAASEAGQKSLEGFMQYMVDVGPLVLSFIGAFFRALGALGKALAPWGEMVLTGLTDFLNFIADMDPALLGAIAAALIGLTIAFQMASGIVAGFYAGLAAIATRAGRIVLTLGVLGTVVTIAAIEFKWFRDLLIAIGEWLVKNADWLMDFATIVLIAASAFKLYNSAIKLAMALKAGYMAASYGAASATLAQGGAAAFATKATLLLNAAMKRIPLILIASLIIGVVAALVKLYNENETFREKVQAVWAVVKAAGEAVWNGIRWALNKLARAMQRAWDNVFQPVLSGLGDLITWLWEKVAEPSLGALVKLWRGFSKAVRTTWRNILRPIFNLFGKLVSDWWKVHVRPAFRNARTLFERLGSGIERVWDKTIKKAFDAIVDALGGKEGLKAKFKSTVDGIKEIWNGLRAVLAAPIRFFLEKVINGGLVKGFNRFASWVGLDEDKQMKPIGIPEWMKGKRGPGGGGGSFATGGVLPGYTPGRDVHHFVSPTGGRLNLSGGEAIMRPEVTAALGTGWVNQVNAAARSGGVDKVRKLLGGTQAFARGGVFWPVPKGWYVDRTAYNLGHDGMDINHPADTGNGQGGVVPFHSATTGVVSYTGYGRGYGNAVFVNSPYGELVYGHAYPGSIRVGTGARVSPGQQLGLIGNTGRSTGPHLHFGFPGGTFYAAEALLNGAGTLTGGDFADGKGKSWPSRVLDALKSPLNWVKGLVSKPLDALRDGFGGAGPVVDTLTALPRKIFSAAKDKLLSMAPVEALQAAGHTLKTINPLARGIGAVVDLIPGLGGEGGEGGLPYNGTMKYDAGGYLPPGLTSVVNLTGKPEPVFTSSQFEQMGIGVGSGATYHYEPHFEGSDLTAEDVAGDMNFQFRQLERRGKYRRYT